MSAKKSRHRQQNQAIHVPVMPSSDLILPNLDLTSIQDERARECVRQLLNLVEKLMADLREAWAEIQRLRDELNRLKGEQGKPDIKPNRTASPGTSGQHSSERERREPKKWQKSSKLDQIPIDREEVLKLDRASLPPDSEFKGYEPVVVQDLRISTDNIKFLKEKYYSALAGKTYLAPLPKGYDGEFGPGVKSLSIVFAYGCNMTEPKMAEWFGNVGIRISAGQISNLLTGHQENFHAEKDAIVQAGLASSPWQHMDDTGTRVDGRNRHCQVVCNPLYTAYFTTERKDRLTVIDVLRSMRERVFRINDEALGFLRQFALPARVIESLGNVPRDQNLSEAEFHRWLDAHIRSLGPQQRSRILEAAAVAAYHAAVEHPVVRLLLCDDAPQFKLVTKELALCWIHDGRHYKKLDPYIAHHRYLLDSFLEQYWDFYKQLLAFRGTPTPEHAVRLSDEFDRLFSTVTGYDALDERIAKTEAKKSHLLMVLRHPEIPLHNNAAELAARFRVRKRAVSYGPRSEKGIQAWDTFHTLCSTAKKLGVSFYRYIHDRVSKANQMLALAELIGQRAEQLNLGGSWDSS
jgi:hypothetical protein